MVGHSLDRRTKVKGGGGGSAAASKKGAGEKKRAREVAGAAAAVRLKAGGPNQVMRDAELGSADWDRLEEELAVRHWTDMERQCDRLLKQDGYTWFQPDEGDLASGGDRARRPPPRPRARGRPCLKNACVIPA